MFEIGKTCCTCLNKNPGELVNVSEMDSDMVTYIDKLKSCINTDVKIFELNEICDACINHLRITYTFLEMVKAAQEKLRNYKENLQLENNGDVTITEASDLDSVTCENIFDNNSDLHKHSADVDHLENKVQSDIYTCSYCPKTFCSISTQRRHINLHKKHFNNAIKSSEDLDQKKLENSEGYRCEYCGLEFLKKWMMQRHRQRVHAEKKFACNYCEKAFKQSYHLNEHIRLHTGEMNYECNLCGKKFSRLFCHRRHMRSHQTAPGEKTTKTPFLCSICGKSFPYSNCMERHMRVHQGIRKYECVICKRKFGQSTHLKVHMRVHTGEKPYICHYCGDGFSLNAKLRKHLAVSHEGGVKGDEVKSYVNYGTGE